MSDWLNYHHLHYFWLVAREGNLTRAARKLHLSPSTVSAQIRQLEDNLGHELFHRQGRRLVLTDIGRTTLAYADDIFALGQELSEAVRPGDGGASSLRVRVGIADILPKAVAFRFLHPAYAMGREVHLVCREDSPERLVADLAVHEIDVVLSDAPVGLARGVRAHTHPIGGSAVAIYAVPARADSLRRAWPDALAGAPILLQAEGTTLRRSLDRWFAERSIRPLVVGEFEDSALLKSFGREGIGCFAMPTILEAELRQNYGVELIGELTGVEEQFFAITMQRRPSHAAVRHLVDTARAMVGARS